MTTSAVDSSAGTAVSFFCHACTARFSLPAPSSPFDFTICPRCRGSYLDDDDDGPDHRTPPEPAVLLLLPPPLPPWLSSPSGSSSYAMTQPPPPPVCVLWPQRSSGATVLPLPPVPSVVRSSPSSSSSCTRPSTSSTRPLPTTMSSGSATSSSSSTRLLPTTMSSCSATSSSVLSPYYCTEHSAGADGKQAERDRSCRVQDSHEDQPGSCSSYSTVSPPSSAYSSICSSPRLEPPPPLPLRHGELQPAFTLPSSTTVESLETVSTSQDLCPPPPPPPPLPLASAALDAWNYFFSTSGEERSPAPTYRDGQLPTPTPQPPLLASAALDTWDYFFSTSGEERPPPPTHRDGQQPTSTPPPPPPPPVSTYDSMFNAPLQRGGPQAAPPAAIAALPTVTVTDSALVCPICTEPLQPSAAARRLPCDHLYHSDCIVTWMSLRNSCPVCRRSIPVPSTTTADTAPLPSLPQQQTPGRRRSLPGAHRIRRFCRRLLRSMVISRGRSST